MSTQERHQQPEIEPSSITIATYDSLKLPSAVRQKYFRKEYAKELESSSKGIPNPTETAAELTERKKLVAQFVADTERLLDQEEENRSAENNKKTDPRALADMMAKSLNLDDHTIADLNQAISEMIEKRQT